MIWWLIGDRVVGWWLLNANELTITDAGVSLCHVRLVLPLNVHLEMRERAESALLDEDPHERLPVELFVRQGVRGNVGRPASSKRPPTHRTTTAFISPDLTDHDRLCIVA